MISSFFGCSSLKSIDLSSFNTKNTVDMSSMFCECQSLTSINLSHFNTEKDTINICQTCKKDNPYINMSIKNPLLDQNMENNSFPPEAYTILTTQIRELSQENKEKDNKIEKLYRQLQMEQKNSKILKDKICKIKKEINKINERNQRNFQLYVLKSDEHLYNTEKGYLKRIRELELELYKEMYSINLDSNEIPKYSEEQMKQMEEKKSKDANTELLLIRVLKNIYDKFGPLNKIVNQSNSDESERGNIISLSVKYNLPISEEVLETNDEFEYVISNNPDEADHKLEKFLKVFYNQKKIPKLNNNKTIVSIFAGRKRYLKLLLKYLMNLKNNNKIHEIHFWQFTNNKEDLDYLSSIANVHKTTGVFKDFQSIYPVIENNEFKISIKQEKEKGGAVILINDKYEITFQFIDNSFMEITITEGDNRFSTRQKKYI